MPFSGCNGRVGIVKENTFYGVTHSNKTLRSRVPTITGLLLRTGVCFFSFKKGGNVSLIQIKHVHLKFSLIHITFCDVKYFS